MEKNRINRFVQKYNLAGLIESVKWDVEGTTLSTSFISDDKSVLGTVTTTDFDFDGGSYGVYDTTKFTKMLSVLENDIDLSIDGWVSVNDILIEEGHAYDYHGGTKKDFKKEIEEEKENKR